MDPSKARPTLLCKPLPALPTELKKFGLEGLEVVDRHAVKWDGHRDSENPLHWSSKKKWANVLLVGIQATLPSIAATLLAVGNLELAQDFHFTNAYTLSLPVALFILGLGLGPLYLAPLSEIYGRRIVYIVSFLLFTIANAACGVAQNIAVLSFLRLVAGMTGSAGPSLGGGTIGDLFAKEDRGKAQALYGFGPTGGPIIGGVIGGLIIQGTRGWRWLMWIMVIAPGITVILSLFFMNETYAPFLLRQKAQRLRKKTGDLEYNAEFHAGSEKFTTRAFTRPLRLLFFSPICAVMSLYMSLVYGIIYLHIVTISLLFGPEPIFGLFSYRFRIDLTGLAYLGAGIGLVIGTFISAKYLNRSYVYMAARHARKTGSYQSQPEFRLPFMQAGMIIVPIGLIIYAWTAGRTHWLGPLSGACIFCLGMTMAYICIQMYIVDAFEMYAASAMSALIVSRSVVGCIFSLIGFQLYKRLGYAWGTMLLAFLCIAMTPVPVLLYIYGPRLRKKKFKF